MMIFLVILQNEIYTSKNKNNKLNKDCDNSHNRKLKKFNINKHEQTN